MPEGPSIYLVRETLSPLFSGKKITAVTGNADIDMERMVGEKLVSIKTWGKHLLLCFSSFTVRIHFLMFGTYSLDEQIRQDRAVRLRISFGKRTLYFYTSSVKILEGKPGEFYDWESDTLNKKWKDAKAKKKLKEMPGAMVCDAILDQDVFGGAGNIIKNEVLFRVKLHPETRIRHLPARKLGEMVREVKNYSFDFLKWKKAGVLKKNWLAYTKKTCPRCDLPIKKKYCGLTKRRTFFCTNCQVKYTSRPYREVNTSGN